jgi:hypothetical protein
MSANGSTAIFSMRVHKDTQTDVGPIAHVHVTAWQACYRGLMPDEFLDRLSVPNVKQVGAKRSTQLGA